jgi:hypothetical protein
MANGANELDEAWATTAFYAQAIETLSGRETIRSTDASGRDTRTKDRRRDRDFACELRSGRIYSNEVSSQVFPAISATNRLAFRQIEVFDGATSKTLRHTRTTSPLEFEAPSERPYLLHVFPDDRLRRKFFPWQWAGLVGYDYYPSLNDILKMNGAAFVEDEPVDGVVCRRFEVFDGSRLYVLWLDPYCDWLPRRIEFRGYDGDVKAAMKEKPLIAFHAHEFRRFRDSRSDAQFWFPVRGEISQGWKFELHELTINPPTSSEQFQIDVATLPDGVRIMEEGKLSAYTGGARDVHREIIALMDQEFAEIERLAGPALPPGATQSKTAKKATPAELPRRGESKEFSWPRTIGGMVAAVALLGFLVVRRLRRRAAVASVE